MTNNSHIRTISSSTDAGSDRTHQRPAPQPKSKSWIDRSLYAVTIAIMVVLVALVAQIWGTHKPIPTLAIRNSALRPAPYNLGTATATTTATPVATPTPGTRERVALEVELLQRSWDVQDWRAATGHLNQIALLDGNYPGLSTARCDTYLHWAQDLESKCQLDQAHAIYLQASPYCGDRKEFLRKRDLALRYLSGKWSYDRRRWSQAASLLHKVYETDPDYAAGCSAPSTVQVDTEAVQPSDVRSLLYASYLVTGAEYMEDGQIENARKAAKAALELVPDGQEASKLLTEISDLYASIPSSSGEVTDTSGRRIEVSISRQRMYVWRGDALLYDWVASTGEPGRGTATGRYKVQSKIPEAWASQWSLRMPYWLGIYYVSTVENGIHALPIRSDGSILWDGYLGTPVSYGCVILSTENARTLYHWADIGTPVWIHR